MSITESLETPVEVAAENIGGIDRTTVSLEPGVNVLTGRNATNRTSFLQAIMAALGSERPSLKGDADQGSATLAFGENTYTRSISRRNGHLVFDGDPYLEDAELADLFAFLLESNEARRAVGRGDDLRELIMRPIDTDEIQAQITLLETEKRDIDEQLADLERLAERLPELEAERVGLDDEIADLERELETVETELEELDADVEESQAQKSDLERTFADLRRARQRLESARFDLETEREARSELEREREELEERLEAIDGDEDESPARLEGRVQELRERKRALDTTLNDLQSVIRFNEERLEEGGIDLGEARAEGGDLTDALVDDEITCWTCGSAVEREHIRATLERLQTLHQERLTERNDLQSQIDDLTRKQKEIRQHTQEVDRLERRLETLERDLERHDERIETLEAETDDREEEVERLESEAESFEEADTDYSDVLEAHRDANGLEIALENTREQRGRVDSQIADLEERLESRADLEGRREEITDELTDLRTRVERIEADAVEAFNDHMESILAILEYANIERIWIERREREVREGRRTVSRRAFELHVIRSTADGATYEDTIDHLSESEREVTGLVFGLAGYLVHDVHDTVPFMLLDSLEAIDSDRIAAVVEYFEDYVDCLVVALLPEDASALSEEHHYVTEI